MLRSLLLILLLVPAVCASAENLLYHENLDGDLIDYQIAIESSGDGTEYVLTKEHDLSVLSTERILVDEEGNTLAWDFSDPGAELEIHGVRYGSEIRVEKIENGRSESENYRLKDDSPWHQLFPFGMEEFVTEGEAERSFWFIQPQNLKLSSMRAVRGEETVITRRGMRERAVEVEITINNWLSRFWKGLYVLRSRDGRYLFYEGILRKNLARGTVELVAEQP